MTHPATRVMLVMAAVMAAAPRAGLGDDAADRVEKIQAAFTLSFIRYTEWPAGAFAKADAPLVVGVIGNATVVKCLGEMSRGEVIKGHPLVIRPVQLPAADQEDAAQALAASIAGCHAVYCSDVPRPLILALLKQLPNDRVLTIGDTEGFARQGGMIGLIRERDRVVFEANSRVIYKSKLSISSKVMKLARIITTEPRE